MDTAAIIASCASHAASLGIFETPVLQHEPKAALGAGLHCAIWVQQLTAVRSTGLATVTARLQLTARCYLSMLHEPQDEIDPLVVSAVDAMFSAYCGDFSLGGRVRAVDIFGSLGPPLDMQAGYAQVDATVYRVATVTLPLIVDDQWPEAP